MSPPGRPLLILELDGEGGYAARDRHRRAHAGATHDPAGATMHDQGCGGQGLE